MPRLTRLLILVCLLLLPACSQRMSVQPSYRPLEPSSFFPDGRSARPRVTGTVARGQLRIDTALHEGRTDDGAFVDAFPFEVSKGVLERGQQRYDIFCSVCHGLTGHGDGRIVERGFTKPPNLVSDLSRGYKLKGEEKKLTEVSVGYIYSVIHRGFGAMPDYASQIPVKDRWAITAYVRALQYSQSPELRKKMEADKKGGKQ